MARTLLFYTHAFSGGGAEIVFARLARAFAESGDQAIFAADYGPAPADTPRLRHVTLGPDHRVATLALARLLRTQRPDASFSALGAQNLKHVAASALAGRLGRCILGYHGFAQAEPRLLSRWSYRLSPILTRLAARGICVSDALLEDMVERWGARRDRLVRIHNPIVLPGTSASPVADPGLVLAVGRLVPVKRFGDLVAAFARVRSPGSRLVILGEGPERAALEDAVTRHALGDRVRLPGHADDPGPWYARAACLVISSESESFGLTAAEALSHGVPVVATACGGPPEVLGATSGCQVVRVGDVDGLAAGIETALAEPGDADARRARAACFALPRIRDRYAALADALG